MTMRKLFLLAFACFSALANAQFSAPKRAYMEYLIAPDHASRKYSVGEQAMLKVEAFAGGNPVDGEWLYYKVGDEMFLPAKYDSVMIRNGHAEVSMGTRIEPGFRAADVYYKVEGKTVKDLVKVAFEPDYIKTFATIPNDFDKFWKTTLREMEKTPINPEVTPIERFSNNDVKVYLVKLNVGKNGRSVYGYLSIPNDGKKHPVMFSPPGAGANKISTDPTVASRDGFIYFNIEIHGLNPEMTVEEFNEAKKVADNYNTRNIESKENFYYRDVYAACSRCVDFLCSLPEWDGKNVCVTGGSQGGALTIVTAALNPKVTLLAPFYPALCDLTGFLHDRAGGWPKYFSGNKDAKKLDSTDEIINTMQYYDVVNFARKVTQPGYYSWGWNDNTCSPTSVHAMYNEVTAPKIKEITPISGHWRYPETHARMIEWMKKNLK